MLREDLKPFIVATTGEALLRFIESSAFKVDRIEKLRFGSRDYFAFLGLTESLKARFGVSGDELLMIVLHNRQQYQYFLPEVRAKVKQLDRISKTAVLVVSADPEIEKLCRNAYADSSTGYKTAYVAITLEKIEEANSRQLCEVLLINSFQQQAFSVDHFDTRSPVPDDLFGRTSLVAQLEADVRSRPEGVAILGIRRAGKTSVLKRVISQLQADPESPRPVGYYDAQSDSIDATSALVADSLHRTLMDSASQFKLALPERPARTAPLEHLRRCVDLLIHKAGRKIVLAIDEIEWLIPTGQDANVEERGRDYLRLFGTLRSLKQTYGDSLGLLLCGINESFCEMPEIVGYPNPSLDWFKPRYVTLLTQVDTALMLRELGSRMGLTLSDEFLRLTWGAFGGHAYLARQFCSEIVRGNSIRPRQIAATDFNAHYKRFLSRAGGIFEAILKYLVMFYPDEYATLRDIARASDGDYAEGAARHLVEYGLVDWASGRYRITQDALASYIAGHSAEDVRRERFKLLDSLGQGVSGVVWQAWDVKRRRNCALKIYVPGTTREAAEYEHKMLLSLGSQFLPETYGVYMVDDRPALAMELLPGRTLRRVLAERGRLYGTDLELLIKTLCRALESIHPAGDRIESLRLSTRLSPEQFDELQKLLAGGFLHRDIKPENIMVLDEERWEVKLMDLQLATPAAAARLTMVGTPAYLPPDWGIEKWNTSFDLYALTCVAFECSTGELPTVETMETVMTKVADPCYLDEAKAFFLKALDPSSSVRYQTVGKWLRDWESAALAFV
jgi:hypothetical protein